jgi:hypothetical protein
MRIVMGERPVPMLEIHVDEIVVNDRQPIGSGLLKCRIGTSV